MALIGGRAASLVLSRYKWQDVGVPAGYRADTKLETLFGPSFWNAIRGKRVLDFGCGYGDESIAMALRGAAQVVGLDIRDEVLAVARSHQTAAGVHNCMFVQQFDATA